MTSTLREWAKIRPSPIDSTKTIEDVIDWEDETPVYLQLEELCNASKDYALSLIDRVLLRDETGLNDRIETAVRIMDALWLEYLFFKRISQPVEYARNKVEYFTEPFKGIVGLRPPETENTGQQMLAEIDAIITGEK